MVKAMGTVGMLNGYPLFKIIDTVDEFDRAPQEPDPFGDYEYDEEGDYDVFEMDI